MPAENRSRQKAFASPSDLTERSFRFLHRRGYICMPTDVAQGPARGERGGRPRRVRKAVASIESDNDQGSSRVQKTLKTAKGRPQREMMQGGNSRDEVKPPSGNGYIITSPSMKVTDATEELASRAREIAS